MYEVDVLNREKDIVFTKKFESMFELRNFVKKCRYSKKLKIIRKPNNWNE